MTTLHDAIQSICDRIEHGSLEDVKEILDALEEALSNHKTPCQKQQSQ